MAALFINCTGAMRAYRVRMNLHFAVGEIPLRWCCVARGAASISRGSNGYARIDVRFPDKNDKLVQNSINHKSPLIGLFRI